MNIGDLKSETMTSESTNTISNIKWSLEGWREIIILADNVLSWEKDFYGGIIAGLVTLFYLILWYIDPTFLTFVAVNGFLITLADYLGPRIIPQIFGVNSWNGAKEKHFDLVCKKISLALDTTCSAVDTIRDFRKSKPLANFVATLTGLIILAWIGNKINNLFLAYIITMFFALLPGLTEKGLLQQLIAVITAKVGELYKSKGFHKKAE